MEALLRGLDQAAQASLAVPVWVLLAGHSLTAVDAMHGTSPFWLVSWLLGFTAAFGGGTLSALLLQNPGAASVALFAKNEVGLVYTLAWWAHGYLPGGLLRRAYAQLPLLRCVAQLCRAVLRATTVAQRVNAAARLHSGVVAAPLLLGTLGGAGGKLLTDAFLYCAGYRQGPNELSHPGYALRSAAVGACLQYFSVHVLGTLSAQQGLGLLIALYVSHSLATDLTGQLCDYTAPLGSLFHKLTLIPDPAQPAGAKATAARQPRAAAARSRSRSRGRPAAAASSPAHTPRGRRSVQGGREKGDDLATAAAALVHAAVQRTTRRRAAAGAGMHQE